MTDPFLGRFTQEDPTQHQGRDFNLYRYALNAPTELVDPTGEISAADLFEIVNLVLQVYIESQTLETPCSIANAVAAGFGYLIPVAEIVIDPTAFGDRPTIEPEPLLELTGCNTR